MNASLRADDDGDRDSPAADALLEKLNDSQREAVTTTEGPVLVLAGAGTGKTRALTTRIAYLIRRRLAAPGRILAVTFTNKAAREMRRRVETMLGDHDGMRMRWLGTFHAIGAAMLRRHAECEGLDANFTILDADDQKRLLKQCLQERNLDPKRIPPQAMAACIDRWKNRGLFPEDIPPQEAERIADSQGGAVYELYQRRLQELNAVDFGDLLMRTTRILRNDRALLETYRERFAYLLVDEYQDTNIAQYLLLRLLAQKHRNLCCVGDDDQSIYSWRGAEIDNILRFETDFPKARIIRLERNYRSTPTILKAASGLIDNNRGRLGKTLWAPCEDSGRKIQVATVWNGEEEAAFLGSEIDNLVSMGKRYEDIAVLTRVTAQMREIEERFIAVGLPYRVVGGARFYDRLEIRDALAYLRLVFDPRHDLAFERIANTPKRGIGGGLMIALRAHARDRGASLYEAARELAEDERTPKRRRTPLQGFIAMVETWRSALDATDHVDLTERILEESGYLRQWRDDRAPDAPGRLENLKELTRAMEKFDSLDAFLDHVSLVFELDDPAQTSRVSLMTLHAAKGLEFDAVFLPGWEEDLFPNKRSLEEGERSLEEERRLAYVGLTRARERVWICRAQNRRLYGGWDSPLPSRFIAEIPEEARETLRLTGAPSMTGRRRDDDPPPYRRFAPESRHDERRHDERKRSLSPPAAESPTGGDDRKTRERRRSSAPPGVPLRSGDRVLHKSFGRGRVVIVNHNIAVVAFDDGDTRKIMHAFLSKA